MLSTVARWILSTILVLAGAGFAPPPGPPIRPYTSVKLDDSLPGLERARRALEDKTPVVRDLFAAAGVSFPARDLVLRVFKDESTFEVWANGAEGEPLVHVTTYQVCAMSGDLGPKRREGDWQVPEGFYRIQYLWPNSAFYLAMRVGYPNVSDRILGDPQKPGSDIMIHGGCASVGCIALSDERIEELWAIVSPVPLGQVELHIFPTRDFAKLAEHEDYAQHADFWRQLEVGYRAFEDKRRPTAFRITWDGKYELPED